MFRALAIKCMIVDCANAQVSKFPLSAMFGMCSLFLLTAGVCQRQLAATVAALPPSEVQSKAGLLTTPDEPDP